MQTYMIKTSNKNPLSFPFTGCPAIVMLRHIHSIQCKLRYESDTDVDSSPLAQNDKVGVSE